ncbi:hypothetical protein [Micromonospora sp. NPDC003816]|uniref:hypothetical protein n=1 Tax=Micromonospora sp. NPDC003816 TaxID=3364224 RepID=UPI0036AAD19E
MGSKRNVASGTDRVAVQAGQVHGRRDTSKSADTTTAETGPVRTENVRSGNARVGQQADVVTGGLHIRF